MFSGTSTSAMHVRLARQVVADAQGEAHIAQSRMSTRRRCTRGRSAGRPLPLLPSYDQFEKAKRRRRLLELLVFCSKCQKQMQCARCFRLTTYRLSPVLQKRASSTVTSAEPTFKVCMHAMIIGRLDKVLNLRWNSNLDFHLLSSMPSLEPSRTSEAQLLPRRLCYKL